MRPLASSTSSTLLHTTSLPSYFFGKHILDSAEGVQQGDPLGPLLFSLTIHQLLVSLKSEFKIFYLDDGTIGGPLEDVVADFKRIEQVSDDLGLAINHSKSEVICVNDITHQGIQSISPMFQITDPADACLLGSPIGGPQSINQVLYTKKASLERLGERLRLLHSHDDLCLLKNALALPKVLYVLRTAPCFDSPILPELDSLQKSLLEDICNVHLSDEAWAQASLPVRAGGLGIRRFTKLATPAFLASAAVPLH